MDLRNVDGSTLLKILNFGSKKIITLFTFYYQQFKVLATYTSHNYVAKPHFRQVALLLARKLTQVVSFNTLPQK